MRAWTRLFVLCALSCCGNNGGNSDSATHDASVNDGCAAPNIWRYEQPGCGATARAVCGSPVEDLCARLACSCAGKLIIGCDYYSEPWIETHLTIEQMRTAKAGDPCPAADL